MKYEIDVYVSDLPKRMREKLIDFYGGDVRELHTTRVMHELFCCHSPGYLDLLDDIKRYVDKKNGY